MRVEVTQSHGTRATRPGRASRMTHWGRQTSPMTHWRRGNLDPNARERTQAGSMADVDPGLAQRVRDSLFRELDDEVTTGVGAHFPELAFGRVLTGQGRRWQLRRRRRSPPR